MRLEISFQRPDSCRRRDKVSCIDFAFEDWDMPVPRIGERIFHGGLDELEDDDADSEWRVVDVWWEPDADDHDNIRCEPQPHCVVMARLVGVEPDSEEDVKAYHDWYYAQQKNEWPEARIEESNAS
jgi:hypothetical protein